MSIGTSIYLCPEPQIQENDKFALGYDGESTPPENSPVIPA